MCNNYVYTKLTCFVCVVSSFLPCSVKPLKVVLVKQGKPFVSGQKAELECLSSGSKPTARLKWFKNNRELNNAREKLLTSTNSTRSILTFMATTEDNGKLVSCRAENPNNPEFFKEDGLNMVIHCKYLVAQLLSTLIPR